MRHRKSKAVLNRPADQRKSLLRNLMTSLFLHGKVQTTDAKAKALSSSIEKLITRAKTQPDGFNTVRELKRILYTEAASKQALAYINNTKKTSGFTRRTKIRIRPGDSALVVQVDLIGEEAPQKKSAPKKETPKKAAPKAQKETEKKKAPAKKKASKKTDSKSTKKA